jgi:hypothetical protein
MREIYRMCPWSFLRMAEDEPPQDFWKRAIVVQTLDLVRACPGLARMRTQIQAVECYAALPRALVRTARTDRSAGDQRPRFSLDCEFRIVRRVLGPQEFLRDAQVALDGRHHLLETRQPKTVLLCRHEIRGD